MSYWSQKFNSTLAISLSIACKNNGQQDDLKD
jgi:hypothetical protein